MSDPRSRAAGGAPAEPVPPDASVGLPTYCEADNVGALIPRIGEALSGAGRRFEVIVVDDDSPDGTGDVARALSGRWPVRVHVRRGERGLASAVIAGFGLARAPICVVMDADGSHPVESLPALVAAVADDGADVAVGSRHVPGGGNPGWPLRRRLVSRAAALLARGLTPLRDPTSGMMAVRRALLDGVALDPVGFKIVLEVVVRAAPPRLVEVPIVFADRQRGESKLDSRESLRYLRHLGRLYRLRLGRAGGRRGRFAVDR